MARIRRLLGRLHDAASAAAWFAAGAFGLAALYVLVGVTINGPRLRAAADAALAQTIEQEDDAFCQKYGMAPRTAPYESCKVDLIEIRRSESKRRSKDAELE